MSKAAKKATVELAVGDKAPAFDLPTDGGKTLSLASLKNKNVVLYFYPKDDTPGCTVEAKNFRDSIKEYEKLDTVIIGVSKDSVKSHDKFKEKYCLPFPLLSDEDGKLCEAYGTWVQKSMYGKTYMGIARDTYLIGKDGKIKQIWRKVKPDGHAQEVLDAVKSIPA